MFRRGPHLTRYRHDLMRRDLTGLSSIMQHELAIMQHELAENLLPVIFSCSAGKITRGLVSKPAFRVVFHLGQV